ncbi:MAG: hypothetical protein K0S05_1544 [Agromyces sp.]|jgi:hypothetical protein|nr:hypothetical protein [Agromyces sp.]
MVDTIDGRTAVDEALQQFRDMLASDGYLLSWSEAGDEKVVVEIAAGEDACADCLVPLPVMEAIMSKALEPTPYTLDHVILPEGEGH